MDQPYSNNGVLRSPSTFFLLGAVVKLGVWFALLLPPVSAVALMAAKA
jgi:hypothetical protein